MRTKISKSKKSSRTNPLQSSESKAMESLSCNKLNENDCSKVSSGQLAATSHLENGTSFKTILEDKKIPIETQSSPHEATLEDSKEKTTNATEQKPVSVTAQSRKVPKHRSKYEMQLLKIFKST